MNTRSAFHGVRCTICALLLASGAMAFEVLAGPLAGDPETIDAPSGDVRIDQAALDWARLEEVSAYRMGAISDLLWNDANASADPARAPVAGGVRAGTDGKMERASYAQLIFWEAMDGALRMTRDALFDGGDMASFSLAGMEVNLALKGRSLTVNGHDVFLPADQPAAHSADVAITAGPAMVPVASQAAHSGAELSVAKIRELLTHPFAIFLAFVCVAMWFFVQLWGFVRAQ
jgi:hypothetical protein